MNLYFFPAITGSYLAVLHSLPKDMIYWCDESPIAYKKVMLSFGSAKQTKAKLRKELLKDCNAFVFVDSGGLQTFTIGLSVNINELIDFQNEYADWALSLDYAPAGVNDTMETVSLEKIEDYAKMTGRNNKIMLDKVDKPLWGILHGDTLEQIEVWYKYAIKDYVDDLEGVAIAFRPTTNYATMVRQMLYLYQNGVKKIHLLGAGNEGAMLISAAILKRNYFDLISMDSSKYSMAAAYGRFYTQNSAIYIGKRYSSDVRCHCPVCTKFNFTKDVYIDINWYVKLTLHNLWRLLDFYDHVYNLYNSDLIDMALKNNGLYDYVSYMENVEGWL